MKSLEIELSFKIDIESKNMELVNLKIEHLEIGSLTIEISKSSGTSCFFIKLCEDGLREIMQNG